MTPIPTTPAAAAARVDELLVEIYKVTYSPLRDKMKEAIRAQNFENQLRGVIASALISARQAALTEQMEDDCKAVCRYCKNGMAIELQADKYWMHPTGVIAEEVPQCFPCYAFPIRTQAAATKAVSDMKG